MITMILRYYNPEGFDHPFVPHYAWLDYDWSVYSSLYIALTSFPPVRKTVNCKMPCLLVRSDSVKV